MKEPFESYLFIFDYNSDPVITYTYSVIVFKSL
jgi:hypothetical protein